MRANRSTFQQLVSYLRGDMEKQRTNWKVPVPVEKRIAAALYFMGHGGDLQRAADDFDISVSLFHKIFKEFVEAVIKRMGHLLSWPSSVSEMREIMNGFWERRHLPGCCGAIDCSHILVTSPDHEETRPYLDRSGHKSVILQAVVDCQGRFLDVFAGWPGSVHDQRVYSESLLFEQITRGGLLDEYLIQVQGKDIGAWLVGDAGYALKPWMIVPYPGHDLPKSK